MIENIDSHLLQIVFFKFSAMNSENQARLYLRRQLFTIEARNTPGKILEENKLEEYWEKYIDLNFKLTIPGPNASVAELRKMVASHETPDYKGGTKGKKAQPIPPRRLSDKELGKLEEILQKYEILLRDIWKKRLRVKLVKTKCRDNSINNKPCHGAHNRGGRSCH